MLLCDINEGNFGFALHPNITESTVKIVDFMITKKSIISAINQEVYSTFIRLKIEKTRLSVRYTNLYVFFNIVGSFLHANILTFYA